ncbi:glycosyl hydrolase [Truncatella angustata]|uniref:Glycosyl hydrolase n=1 Tax=Truncatella angustata TaxID=152316 RepID=A0A9P8ZVV7_9PEZI|nr:glycosyl hydrolase [Truncatella angustata]KAH6649104.1 glycosyl hydrolase [Truncatella angustata]
MKSSVLFAAGTLGAHYLRQDITSTVDYNLEPVNLSTLANGTLFETWRPRAHILPPFGGIGDPCGHYVDAETGSFHVGWLYNGNGASGAITDDLITYMDLNTDGAPFIVPGGENDPVAVFDGTVINVGINGLPTWLYTSVSYLPIQWTIAYTRGSETQSLAVSYDGGKKFTKIKQGPAIPAPPFAVNVTGFRDPFAFQSVHLDSVLGSDSGTWYVVISGGVHGYGPSQFLYRQHDPEFQYWEELGRWWHEPANTTWGNGDWAGRWGFNFEVSNIFTLDEAGYNDNGTFFTTLGAEWSLDPIVPEVSDFRDSLWAAGDVRVEDGDTKFTPSFAGKLDWGDSAYASHGQVVRATSQPSRKSSAPDRFITTTWLTGNFYGTQNPATNQQNWTGALLLPRELSIGKISNVVDNELSRELGSWKTNTNESGIAREPLAALIGGNFYTEGSRNLSSPGVTPFQKSPDSKFFVLQAAITFPSSARNSDLKAGLQILASEHEATTIYYQFSNESIIVDRTNTSAAARTTSGIDSRNEAGRFRLFDITHNGTTSVEALQLTIVVDNGILEVHANDRFALSTWVRSWYSSSTEVRFFYEGTEQVSFGDITVSEGLYDAWPERSTVTLI